MTVIFVDLVSVDGFSAISTLTVALPFPEAGETIHQLSAQLIVQLLVAVIENVVFVPFESDVRELTESDNDSLPAGGSGGFSGPSFEHEGFIKRISPKTAEKQIRDISINLEQGIFFKAGQCFRGSPISVSGLLSACKYNIL